ncbi:Formin-like protein 3 [Nosema granulosis]|uniref:Formin-like protein 3 n=1 Tax=Nosema granulosis TaxID=83296 RepID=A0A9P6H1P9_9MICR|nr:Formin-like protein 3 [Nosema granulosis]
MEEDRENEMDVQNLCVNKPSSKILAKIRQFSKGCEEKKKFSRETAKFLPTEGSRINIWEVTQRIFVVGQIWKSGTEWLSHKNNLDEAKSYLDDLFKSKYIVLSKDNELNVFERVLQCSDLWYDLDYINKVCIAIKAWMDLSEENVVVIEINYNFVTLFAILLDALLIYCGYENSIVENIFIKNDILRSKTNNLNTIFRYKKYYTELIHTRKTEVKNVLLLHQIIISNYHHFDNIKHFRVQLKVFQKNKNVCTVHDVDDIEVVYKDDFYIIFTNMDIEASGDTTLCLYFVSDTVEKEIFKFVFNGLCHDQGLYRFKKDDILSKYKYKFSDDFKLDIVFLESEKYFTTKKTLREDDLIQGIRHLTEFTKETMDENVFDRYNLQGYNRIISKFIAQMQYTEAKVKDLITFLTSKGYTNLICQSKPLTVSQIKFKNDSKIETPQESKEPIYPLKESIDRQCIYRSIKGKEIRRLEPINENMRAEKIVKKQQKKMPIRKKPQAMEGLTVPELVSLKPLHWTPLIAHGDTVFKDLKKLEIKYDLKKFEKYFCVKNLKSSDSKSELKEHYHIIDPKRLFLVSLALNHLNKKGINPQNVYDLLKNKPNDIIMQDLLNIERVFPTYEEAYLLASSESEKLTAEEKAMLSFSRLAEVKKIVEIMIFERRFFDEIFLIDDILERYIYTLDRIVESKELKILLKMLLDIGNIINFDYSLRRRKSVGFRLSSIYLFMDYKGRDDFQLLQYIAECIQEPDFLSNLKRDFKYLEMLRKESFPKIKEKINLFIELCSSKLDVYYSLEHDKDDFTNLFVFSSEKLDFSKMKYQKCQQKIEDVMSMFGESEKRTISDLLQNINDLLKAVEMYYNQPAPL